MWFALLPVESDLAVGAALGARAGTAESQIPHPDAAFSTWVRAGEKGAGGGDEPPWGDAPRERSRLDAAYSAQRQFQEELLAAGKRALATLDETGEPGLVLAGRGYNIYDRGVNCDIPRKLRHRYGANVIPLDFLVTGRESLDPSTWMYWASGRKILEAAQLAAQPAELAHGLHHQLQVRADSYIKHFAREAAGAPLLVLQFDGHGNDAGYMTRCEAYLDSKGILRCYQPPNQQPPATRAAAIH